MNYPYKRWREEEYLLIYVESLPQVIHPIHQSDCGE
jgi:hypothetical protein